MKPICVTALLIVLNLPCLAGDSSSLPGKDLLLDLDAPKDLKGVDSFFGNPHINSAIH